MARASSSMEIAHTPILERRLQRGDASAAATVEAVAPPREVVLVEEEEKVYVAVGKDVKEGKATLMWAIENMAVASKVVPFVLVHVHCPSKSISIKILKQTVSYNEVSADLSKGSIVYEYLPNGTLKQQLARVLSWQDRVRILGEQRSTLICLHTNRPYAIIHADLKPQNNISCLRDFGTARVILNDPSNQETICRKTNPMGTTGYMDPIFLMTGELTPQSDEYSFGVIILQLLTGLLELNIAEQVQEGLRMGVARQILDTSAGDWPEVQAEKLLSYGGHSIYYKLWQENQEVNYESKRIKTGQQESL